MYDEQCVGEVVVAGAVMFVEQEHESAVAELDAAPTVAREVTDVAEACAAGFVREHGVERRGVVVGGNGSDAVEEGLVVGCGAEGLVPPTRCRIERVVDAEVHNTFDAFVKEQALAVCAKRDEISVGRAENAKVHDSAAETITSWLLHHTPKRSRRGGLVGEASFAWATVGVGATRLTLHLL